MVKEMSYNAITIMLVSVDLRISVYINILKRFVLKVFAKTDNKNLDTPKVANWVIDVNFINKTIECWSKYWEIWNMELGKKALEDTIKAQSVIIENHENKIVEMDIIINNLPKIVVELKTEEECTDTK